MNKSCAICGLEFYNDCLFLTNHTPTCLYICDTSRCKNICSILYKELKEKKLHYFKTYIEENRYRFFD